MADQVRAGKSMLDGMKAGYQIMSEAGIYGSSVISVIGIGNERIASDEPLKPGMTLIVEPLPYSKDYNIGFFIADTFAVTEGAPKKLNRFPQQFVVV